MDAVLQPFFLAGSQPAHVEIHQPVDGHSLRFFCGGELGAGFADMRGMAFAGEFFVRFVLPADFITSEKQSRKKMQKVVK